MDQHSEAPVALEFTGTASDFVEVWAKNLVFGVFTLGFYRFWARTNVRRFLWSHTRLWGEPLEYTGTGKELFFGFLLALVVFVVPITALNIAIQALAPNPTALMGFVVALLYLYIFIIANFAMYRAQRYRLTRTLWRGIRGGMAHKGYAYGLKGTLYYIVAVLTAGLAGPWVSTRLWNERWNDSSFGSQAFEADARGGRLFISYLIAMALAAGLLGLLALLFWARLKPVFAEGANPPGPGDILLIFGLFLAFYAIIGLAFLWFTAAYWRTMLNATRWGPVSARFSAGPLDWLLLTLKTLGIVIFSFGMAAGFVPLVTWRFWVRHLQLDGAPDPAALAQSQTGLDGQGEGLADALDMGAF